MSRRLWKRSACDESGFTLIELLMVVVIMGILTSIALPSFLSFKTRANLVAAKADVSSALPAVDAFYADNSTYVGMTRAALAGYEPGIYATLVTGNLTATSYCVRATVADQTAYRNGPGVDIATGTPPVGC